MIAIKNGKVVTVTDKTFEHGTVLIEDGKILAVGENIEIPSDAQVIDASGCWVTPGLIDCHTHISNFNEPSTNPSIPLDGNEMSSPITPQVRAMDAVNPHDYAISKVRDARSLLSAFCQVLLTSPAVPALSSNFAMHRPPKK